ncbi:MAG: hypothetical protein WC002_09300 [Candidatus Muiribacteriota bacterium]
MDCFKCQELTGQNEVPIMIVNEKGERINEIPPINPYNLEGVGMGYPDNYADPIKFTIKFLNEYTDNQKGKFELLLLNPVMGNNFEIIMEESEVNSRIFKGEYKFENDSGEIETDIYELKLNYPIPYPDIILKVGEKRNEIIKKPAIIEYIKINSILINDFDGNKIIEDEEQLKITIWTAPDYSNNKNTNYILSNMISTPEKTAKADQLKYISKDSMFRIKIPASLYNRKREALTVKISREAFADTDINAKKIGAYFETGPIFIATTNDLTDFYEMEDGYYLPLKEGYVKLLEGITKDNLNLNKMTMTVKDDTGYFSYFKESKIKGKLVLSLYSIYQWAEKLSDEAAQYFGLPKGVGVNPLTWTNVYKEIEEFEKVIKTINDKMGYVSMANYSPTIDYYENLFKIDFTGTKPAPYDYKIFYFKGHGKYNIDSGSELIITGNLKVNEDSDEIEYIEGKITLETVKRWRRNGMKDIDIVFLEACEAGNIKELEEFEKADAFGSKCMIGFSTVIFGPYSTHLANRFFELLSDAETTADDSLRIAYRDTHISDDPELFYLQKVKPEITNKSKGYILDED